ncbi:MAG: DUF1223 domain-containing protein [Candidatus Angelobacter sp.]
MKRLSALAVLLGATLSLAAVLAQNPGPAAPPSGPGKAVVVELFTSEGCSSCPPADALLDHLRQDLAGKNIQVIPLGFHVDYWNFQGWKDRFSSAEFTRRQQQYARRMGLDGPYTPQMVVDGASEFVGSDAGQAERVISKSANQAALAEVALSAKGADQLKIEVKAPGAANGARVVLAITEDNLSTKVSAGENDGRELRHAAVVRELRELGTTHDGAFAAEIPLKLKKDWKPADLRATVFVQEGDAGKVLGAASIALPKQLR